MATSNRARAELERVFRRPVSEALWNLLEGDEYVDDYEVTGRLDNLLAAAQKFDDFLRLSNEEQRPLRQSSDASGTAYELSRSRAVAVFLAYVADDDPEVVDFRRCLPSPKLTPEGARRWLGSAAAETTITGQSLSKAARVTYRVSDGTNEPNASVAVSCAEYSAADALRELSVTLAARFSWWGDEAAWFVLTGRPPTISTVWARVTTGIPAPPVISIHARPWISRETLWRVFSDLRKGGMGHRERAGSAKNMELACFVLGQFRDSDRELPWRAIAQRWNDLHPEAAYSDWRGLRRQAMASIRVISEDCEINVKFEKRGIGAQIPTGNLDSQR
jgi:hypothetical protein